jgi:glutathione peroxidase-family protein
MKTLLVELCVALCVTAGIALGASSVHEFTMKTLDGKQVPLESFKGKVIQRFEPEVEPDSKEIEAAVEAALK